MNVHKNARSCPVSRELLYRRVSEQGWSVRAASEAAGMSDRRGREWIRRGAAAEPLTDRSSRPHSGRITSAATRNKILSLRREWRTVRSDCQGARVEPFDGGSDLSLGWAEPAPPSRAGAVPVRYERERPGELIHVDIKRLGRFDRVGHRITRHRSFGSPKQGFEFVYVATDDFTRLSYVDILADERSEAASSFLIGAVAWFAQQKVRVERVMTDNGSAFLSSQLKGFCLFFAGPQQEGTVA